MLKNIGFGVGATIALASGIAFGSAVATSKKTAQVQPGRFNVLAKTYDVEVGGTEASVGIEKLREKLVSQARGRVLETCAGTGRNNAFYDGSKVSEVVLVDASLEMLEEARKKKFPKEVSKVRLIKTDNLESFDSESFDTVLDTFGLCSVPDPQAYLAEVKRVLKPGGQVLLLEHGKAEISGPIAGLVNMWLNFRAPAHADYYGCLWNRQISSIVSDAGFEIKYKELHHLGTCTEIIALKQPN